MVQAEQQSSPLKRKRTTKQKDTAATTPTVVDPPSRILVIDNGGDSIKYGWNTDTEPRFLPNVTARLQQQWTVLVGDQLSGLVQNPTQLVNLTRSTERGIIVNMGNQIQVWKRMLDLLGVVVPLHTPTAKAFGWKQSSAVRNNHHKATGVEEETTTTPKIAPRTCAVILALPPFCPRTVLDQIMTIWMEDFQFAHVGFCVSPVCAAQLHPTFQTCCVVDVGYSHTNIVPITCSKNNDNINKNKVVVEESAIRRMAMGARHLMQIWKYHTSYRQWNLMDQDWILQQVLEEAAFVSLQFQLDMQQAQRIPVGRRPFDRELVLPDFVSTFRGHIQLPPFLQRQAELRAMGNLLDEDDDGDDSDDDDFNEDDMEDDDNDEDFDENRLDVEGPGEEDDEDEEEETIEQIKARLLIQRQEEERRRREAEAQQQILNLSVERFAIPEVLFRPSDAGLPAEWANLPESIYQSIEACPALYRPALYRSIRLVGGLSQLKNLYKRLEQELRCLVKCNYEIQIDSSETATMDAWIGAKEFCSQNSFEKWSISRMEWEKNSKKGAWARLLSSSGGSIV